MSEEREMDVLEMYIEELGQVKPCTLQEEAEILAELAAGRKDRMSRLVEGKLKDAMEQALLFRDRGLPFHDLVQEANMALLLAAGEYSGGDFNVLMKKKIGETLTEAVNAQQAEIKMEEEMAARVNVLKDISASMAKELGREATVEELAERMQMTTDEIKDIMKLTLDAMSVSVNPEA